MPPTNDQTAFCNQGLKSQEATQTERTLASPPSKPQDFEIWLQHVAGYIIFERIRAAGLATIDSGADSRTRAAVRTAVDATIYALMMQIDGVSPGLSNDELQANLKFQVSLTTGDTEISSVELDSGEGMCMGFHSWIEGDFGSHPITVATQSAATTEVSL